MTNSLKVKLNLGGKGWIGWMDAKQGNPVHTPARATLAGATDDDACMVLLYNATKAIASQMSRPW